MSADELRMIAKYEARISAYEIRISHLTLRLAEHDRQILMLQDKLLVAEYNTAILPDTHSQEVAELHRAMKIENRYVRETSSMIDFVEWLKAEPTRNLSFLQKSIHAARERTGSIEAVGGATNPEATNNTYQLTGDTKHQNETLPMEAMKENDSE